MSSTALTVSAVPSELGFPDLPNRGFLKRRFVVLLSAELVIFYWDQSCLREVSHQGVPEDQPAHELRRVLR